jgi:hypothetical protein
MALPQVVISPSQLAALEELKFTAVRRAPLRARLGRLHVSNAYLPPIRVHKVASVKLVYIVRTKVRARSRICLKFFSEDTELAWNVARVLLADPCMADPHWQVWLNGQPTLLSRLWRQDEDTGRISWAQFLAGIGFHPRSRNVLEVRYSTTRQGARVFAAQQRTCIALEDASRDDGCAAEAELARWALVARGLRPDSDDEL